MIEEINRLVHNNSRTKLASRGVVYSTGIVLLKKVPFQSPWRRVICWININIPLLCEKCPANPIECR